MLQLKGQASPRKHNGQPEPDARKMSQAQLRRQSHVSQSMDQHNILQQAELRRLRDRLRDDTRQYLQKEKRIIMSGQLEKVREGIYLKRSIEEYQSPIGGHHGRIKHHQTITTKLSKFRQKQKHEEVSRLSSYKTKWQKLGQRLEDFLRTRQASRQKSFRTNSINSMRQLREPIRRDSPEVQSMAKPKKSFVYRQKNTLIHRVSPTEISERINRRDEAMEQKNIREYMKRMHDAENRIIHIEIKKEISRQQSRAKPVRILTAVRNQRYESKRQQFQKEYEQKIQNHSQLYEKQKKSELQQIYIKSTQENEHSSQVVERKWRLQQLDMKRRVEDALGQTNRSDELKMRKKRIEKVIILKRQFQLKKQQELDKYAVDMSHLSSKLHDLNLLKSDQTLSDKQSKSTLKLVKTMLNSDKEYVDLFTKPKRELAMTAYSGFVNKNKAIKIR